jgi:hypothetical protein
MEKVFVKEEEISTGVWPMVYLADLPSHLAHRGVPSDVARTGMFKLYKRENNELVFKTNKRDDHNLYRARVLKSSTTGNEVCYIQFRGSRILLDASNYMHGGRRVTQEVLDNFFTDDGRTLRQFLADEAAKPLEERL